VPPKCGPVPVQSYLAPMQQLLPLMTAACRLGSAALMTWRALGGTPAWTPQRHQLINECREAHQPITSQVGWRTADDALLFSNAIAWEGKKA
jgi:hypothetical protein